MESIEVLYHLLVQNIMSLAIKLFSKRSFFPGVLLTLPLSDHKVQVSVLFS